jgi:hypothetical protein
MHRFAVLTILLAGIQPLAIDAYRAEAGGGHESKSALTLDVTPRYTFANGTVLGTGARGAGLRQSIAEGGDRFGKLPAEQRHRAGGRGRRAHLQLFMEGAAVGEYVADAVVFGSTGERAHAFAKFSVETLDAATGGRQWHGLWAALQR